MFHPHRRILLLGLNSAVASFPANLGLDYSSDESPHIAQLKFNLMNRQTKIFAPKGNSNFDPRAFDEKFPFQFVHEGEMVSGKDDENEIEKKPAARSEGSDSGQ
jgi:hypothetical protein